MKYLLVFIALLSSCKEHPDQRLSEVGSYTRHKVHVDSISILAQLLPEFKVNVHDTNYQGNQISGVVRTVFEDADGNFWFGTQNGLSRYDGSKLIYFDIKNELDQEITVKAITQANNGNIWIGHTDGVTEYDGTYFINYSTKDGLLSNDVWSIAADRQGQIWIGTFNGVSIFNGKDFSAFKLPAGKANPDRGISSPYIIHDILEDSNSRMWFASNAGVYVYDRQVLTHISEEKGLNAQFINDIMEDHSGQIWVATAQHGLFKYDGVKAQQMTQELLVEGTGINSITEDSTCNIWFHSQNNEVYSYNGNHFSTYQIRADNRQPNIFELLVDQKDRLWAVGFGGAFRMQNDSIQNITRHGPW